MALPYDQIQGFILRGYTHPRARHFMINMPATAAGKKFLAAVTPMITTAAPWTQKPPTLLNIGLTADGLSQLGIDVKNAGLGAEFVEGAIVRGFNYQSDNYNLGDTGDSAPNKWILGLGSGRVHAVLSLYALDPHTRDQASAKLMAMCIEAGVVSLGAQDSDDILGDSRVHFGYHDGISQPNIDGAPPRDHANDQPIVATGEFVLGYNAEGGAFRGGPSFDPANGTYSAFRILEQDVDAFYRYLAWAASEYDLPQEVIQAKFCGRWADGTPLVLSPDVQTGQPVNDFFYRKAPPDPPDNPARSCPIASHIRRSQRRDEDSQAHRILRRAFPYGPPYAPSDGKERGLTGHFICSSLQQQYEFIITQWVNGNTIDANARDPLLGDVDDAHPPTFSMYWKGTKKKLQKFGRFTSTRGGAYCYLPSISGLQTLAK